MLMCFWRGRSTPAIRAIVSDLSWPGAPSLSRSLRQGGDFQLLALALFMFRVDANHPYHTLAVDDLALVANLLDRCSYFHTVLSSQFSVLSKISRGNCPKNHLYRYT